jgi:predicted dehydrogenase
MKKTNTMNRRSFLKRTAAVGLVGVAAPMILPRHVLGINGEPGANERIVIGAIGAGNQGRYLMNRLSRTCRIGAVADVYLPRAQEMAQSFQAPHVFQDYRHLLERSDIDAVVVATPLHWHGLNCIHAAQAGKDIFCEKPLSYSIGEGRKMVEAARKYKRVLQTGIQGRLDRNAYIGCAHVRSGTVGKITRVLAHNYYSPMNPRFPAQPIPDGLDWDLWCGPAEKLPYNFDVWDNRTAPSWVSLRPFSGSSMTDWGSHGLDLAQWGLDMDATGPEEVWVEGEPYRQMDSTPENPGIRQQGVNSPTVSMRYPGGVTLELNAPVRWSEVQFVGPNGTINVTRDGYNMNPAELMRERLDHSQVKLYQGHQYSVQNDILQDWINCIKERRTPGADAEIGQRTTTLCHLANIARWVSEITGETGQKLKWDAANERFTNSEEANTFLNPPRRAGYELPENV